MGLVVGLGPGNADMETEVEMGDEIGVVMEHGMVTETEGMVTETEAKEKVGAGTETKAEVEPGMETEETA